MRSANSCNILEEMSISSFMRLTNVLSLRNELSNSQYDLPFRSFFKPLIMRSDLIELMELHQLDLFVFVTDQRCMRK